ncbi:dTDP-4-dehydrorhamnose reductase [Cellulomonas fimi]|uniref:dTDP-4-dehydrorhamnose reductase n=1 Tax=Cellulomonas fimi (strain ATCC 484 / DSM 20113 / JCM 1341 / CCUG 24087 / LMG 16345 / NBRC 15513 / NCIMB 8980 / NCTC 7547 / NRS-133) TaxID=590998 RepID=F4H524_CELFA|nr:dTDP-4-dehydrorhamnose reductase [Cellulomonas fimi]AEE46630.1 dTDP-4-dehydrorhamnose reductase [Cellulomonas fimi ATCC 484]NNH08338.1 dTDP-4-dehydrorhamnose reductase [Cellulomonas fimi]VEH33714.1 dTDP-4-dehydrorhamnose reductase [Cellulomonas fimi]
MRWSVVGASGMLGQDLVAVLRDAGETVTALDRDEVDITDLASVRAALVDADVVVNTAAYTAVDQAETDEARAFDVNATGVGNLARVTRDIGARLVHVSTDYVFDGHAQTPYDEDAPLAPRSAYGRTKAAGEWAVRAEQPDHLILRTAWLYGAHGACFPKTIARVAAERGGLEVVADQVGQPTWTRDVADLVVRLVAAQAPAGTYHATSSGTATWHEFAQAAVVSAGMDAAIVRPTTAEAYARPAPRPSYSVLGHDRLRAVGVDPIGDWRERWAQAAEGVLAG